MKTVHDDNEKEEKNHVVLFLALRSFSSASRDTCFTTLNPKWWWCRNQKAFSLAYCQEVIACVRDPALCPFWLHLQGQNASVVDLFWPWGLYTSWPWLLLWSGVWDGHSSLTLGWAGATCHLLNERADAIALLFVQGWSFPTPDMAWCSHHFSLLNFLSVWLFFVVCALLP